MINVFDELDYVLNKALSPIHFSTFNADGIFRGWTADSFEELNEWYKSEDFDGPSNDDEVIELVVYGTRQDAKNFREMMTKISELIPDSEKAKEDLANFYNKSEHEALRYIINSSWCFGTDYPYQLEYDARIVAAMNLKHIEGYDSEKAIIDAFGNHSIELKDAEDIRKSTESDYHERFEKLLNTLDIEIGKDGIAVYEPTKETDEERDDL